MNYTDYQIQIFDAVKSGNDNLIIEATAGSGKTTTLIKSCDYIEGVGNSWGDGEVLFCSFSKLIAEELGRRVPFGVDSATLNSIGYRMVREENNNKNIKVNKFKDWNILRSEVDDQAYYSLRSIVDKVIGILKNNIVIEKSKIAESIKEVITYHGIDIPQKYDNGQFEEIVERVYWRSITEFKEISFDDQKLLVVIRGREVGLKPGRRKYKTVLIDESQDLSPLDIELIDRIGNRKIFVGDTFQNIYGFRGATPDAMANIKEKFGCRELPLSICFRCPESVINVAKRVNPGIESPTDHGMSNSKGEGIVETINKEKFLELVNDNNDIILCRTTAPLIKECLKLLPYKKCYVKGREIKEGLERLIRTVLEGEGSNSINIDTFDAKLDDYFDIQSDRLRRLDRTEALAELSDKVDALKALEEKCNNVDDLYQLIANVIGDSQDGIAFMTIHKSKGLEAQNVFLLRRDLLPHKKAKMEWQRAQERNLEFVMITRSQHSLRTVLER